MGGKGGSPIPVGSISLFTKWVSIPFGAYFKHSEGINHYFRENYKLAIETLEVVMPTIADKGDFENVSVGYFYVGRSYWDLREPDWAISFFKKVDGIFNLQPDLREGYELLMGHYKNLGIKNSNCTTSSNY